MQIRLSLRHNILLQYSIITLLLTMLVTIITGVYVGRESKEHLIETHLDLYPVIIHHATEDAPEIASYFDSSGKSVMSDSIKDYIEMLLSIESVFRLKLWDKEKTVIWSDKEELIGSTFPEKKIYEKFSDGELYYELTEPSLPEHEYEKDKNLLLEIYVPVRYEGKTIGAVEIYESNEQLNEKIRDLVYVNRVITASGGILLYILLFSLFARAYKRQKQITEQVKRTEKVTIYALAYQAGLRDEETGAHLKRTSEYVRIIAQTLAEEKGYRKYLNKDYIEDLVRSAPLHDIGKVGIEDSILRKPGKLSEEEFERMKEHCELGARILEDALNDLSFRSFLNIAIHLVRYHHEKWDGSGYPYGVRGEDIPISARIMALADVYDALRSRRVYKPAFSHEKSQEIIRQGRGNHFDPKVVDSFLERSEEFRRISEEMAD